MTTTTPPLSEAFEEAQVQINASVEAILQQSWDQVADNPEKARELLAAFGVEETEGAFNLATATAKLSIVCLVLLSECAKEPAQLTQFRLETEGQRPTVGRALALLQNRDFSNRYAIKLLAELQAIADGSPLTGIIDPAEAFNAIAAKLELPEAPSAN